MFLGQSSEKLTRVAPEWAWTLGLAESCISINSPGITLAWNFFLNTVVRRHLADGVAAGEPDPGVRVRDVVHDPVHDLVQEGLHLLVASLAARGDGHQGRVPTLPVRLLNKERRH